MIVKAYVPQAAIASASGAIGTQAGDVKSSVEGGRFSGTLASEPTGSGGIRQDKTRPGFMEGDSGSKVWFGDETDENNTSHIIGIATADVRHSVDTYSFSIITPISQALQVGKRGYLVVPLLSRDNTSCVQAALRLRTGNTRQDPYPRVSNYVPAFST
jgi:hypothetical protein